jgi:hypothetical protein
VLGQCHCVGSGKGSGRQISGIVGSEVKSLGYPAYLREKNQRRELYDICRTIYF